MKDSALVLQHLQVAGDDVAGLLGVDKDDGPLLMHCLQLLLQVVQLLILLQQVNLQQTPM